MIVRFWLEEGSEKAVLVQEALGMSGGEEGVLTLREDSSRPLTLTVVKEPKDELCAVRFATADDPSLTELCRRIRKSKEWQDSICRIGVCSADFTVTDDPSASVLVRAVRCGHPTEDGEDGEVWWRRSASGKVPATIVTAFDSKWSRAVHVIMEDYTGAFLLRPDLRELLKALGASRSLLDDLAPKR